MALWAIIGCAALVLLCLLYLLLKRARSGTYVAGGRNRKARLAVMDATAIDTHRRLVLVRRDNVEHLILIGGHSDIVVERDINVHGTSKPHLIASDAPHAPELQPAPAKVQLARAEPAPPAQPVQQQQHLPPPPPRQPVAPPRPTPQIQAAQFQPKPVAVSPAPAHPRDEFDNDLLKELETALDMDEPTPKPAKGKSSLDEEMAKLLGELSSHKR